MFNEEDRAILDFERTWWREPGPKDQAIELALGLTAEAYYDHLLRIVGMPSALAYDPLTIKRVLTLVEGSPSSELAVS
jgi:hypothetical protein